MRPKDISALWLAKPCFCWWRRAISLTQAFGRAGDLTAPGVPKPALWPLALGGGIYALAGQPGRLACTRRLLARTGPSQAREPRTQWGTAMPRVSAQPPHDMSPDRPTFPRLVGTALAYHETAADKPAPVPARTGCHQPIEPTHPTRVRICVPQSKHPLKRGPSALGSALGGPGLVVEASQPWAGPVRKSDRLSDRAASIVSSCAPCAALLPPYTSRAVARKGAMMPKVPAVERCTRWPMVKPGAGAGRPRKTPRTELGLVRFPARRRVRIQRGASDPLFEGRSTHPPKTLLGFAATPPAAPVPAASRHWRFDASLRPHAGNAQEQTDHMLDICPELQAR